MGRARCPNCGKRVPERQCCCPRCGHSIPFDIEVVGGELDPSYRETDGRTDDPELVPWLISTPESGAAPSADPSDDGVYDPALLEQAEEYVKFLPDGLFRREERPRMPVAGDSYDEVAAEEDTESGPVGGECSACGRQAQKGWTKCPWCGTALGVDASR